MRFSVFTPTHDTRHFGALVSSLDRQTFNDFEHVVVPNNGALVESDDGRKVLPFGGKGVGSLKRFACSKAQGDYLVEVDHDDTLTPEALEKIDGAIRDTGADFISSDCVEYHANGDSHPYGTAFGWEHYPFEHEGKPYTINRSFQVNAASMAQIYYAPNHVRVWKRELYNDIGGHDESLEVCDDHDLLCRTYLSGAKFHHIPEPIYLYRIGEDNTWLKRNAEIQKKQAEVGEKYRHDLIREWCKRENLPKYDLGGAINKARDFMSVDLRDADVIFDIRKGLPFETSSVGCIRAADVLEHVPSCGFAHTGDHHFGCTVHLMNEIHRVLVPGGWLLLKVPSCDGRGAFQDPTHCSFWNRNSLFYYCRQDQRRFVPGITARFQEYAIQDGVFPTQWERTHNIPYVIADLVALKNQRQPGLVYV